MTKTKLNARDIEMLEFISLQLSQCIINLYYDFTDKSE